jgi:hypothetical protein
MMSQPERREGEAMQDRNARIARSLWRGVIALVAAALAASAAASARAATPEKPTQKATPKTTQKSYATPEAAADALAAAISAQGNAALLEVLGPKAKPIIDSGDTVADANARERFEKAWTEAHAIETEGDAKATLDVGSDRWPFPVPIVKEPSGWRFDTDAGDDEILARRIGRNERSAIQVCLAYVDAQREYYEADPDKDGLLHYASRIASTQGKRDGLYWPTKEGEPESPLGPEFAAAKQEGYAPGKGAPYHGYRYRILTSQGPHAKGGAYDYVARKQLFGGFALVAWPATWGSSGVMTFLVNQDGVVFEKDLGPDTAKAVAKIKSFDPDPSWKAVPESETAPDDVM